MTKGLVGNEYKEEGLMSNSSGMLYRIKTEYKVNNALQKTVYYIGNYECEVYPNGRIREINYINTSTGHTIVQLKDNKNNIPTDSLYYIFKDHLGSYDRITNQLGQTVETYSFDAWGNRRQASDWTIKDVSETRLFTRGFTGHEHLDAFETINMNGRLYDPTIARFLSPDPYVASNTFTQDYNRYSYCRNNPLLYTDPSGEWIHLVIGAAIGGVMNWAMNGAEFSWRGLGYFGVGALSGALGSGIGSIVAGSIGVATDIGGAILKGTFSGVYGGYVGSFTNSAGNAWMNNSNFQQGLQVGFDGGIHGAIGGALIGGVVEGIKFQKQIATFRKGCDNLGVNEGESVPATDQFLFEAQKKWYPDAPMNNVKRFTVEDVPEDFFTSEEAINSAGATLPIYSTSSNKLTGNSYVYFNKNLAFKNAKELFFTMGHELVHVSQYASLVGQQVSLIRTLDFQDLIDLHAYSFECFLGSSNAGAYTSQEIVNLAAKFSSHFGQMNYINFLWTKNVFKPF